VTDSAIPFNRPALVGNEMRYIGEATAAGKISGGGPFGRRAEELLESLTGAPRVLLTTSCTHALEMAALLLEIEPGDEVIVSSFTFVSTITGFVLRGAKPVFADIRPDTLNLDERLLHDLITPRTRAIVLTHYAGVGCAMEPILALANERGIAVVEDNAHGLFGSWKGRPLGTFGSLATLSFHETKNVTCGEGGALILNDAAHVHRAEILREKGTNRSQFFRGEVDRYTWVDLGSSYVLADLLGAYLLAQLEARDAVQAARHRIWNRYRDELEEWARATGTQLPHVPDGAEHPAHLFYLLLPDAPARQRLADHLRKHSILAVSHYVPLDSSPFGHKLDVRPGSCPIAADLSNRLLRLPLFMELTHDEQSRVVAAVRSSSAF
jgi:dTDP-4-amino-4,6-dideoxygalactose transaminase